MVVNAVEKNGVAGYGYGYGYGTAYGNAGSTDADEVDSPEGEAVQLVS